MAQYNIQFSSNASAISKQLSQLQADIARIGISRTEIKLGLDTADFRRSINSSFKELDKAIGKAERRLRKLSIGSPEFTMAAERSGGLRGQRERGQMMASAISSREAAQAFDVGSLARYERALKSLQIQASLIAPNTKEWVNLQQSIGAIRGEMQKASKTAESIQLRETLGAFSPGSLNQLNARLTILKTRAYDIKPDTKAWQQLNKEIQRTERNIKKLSSPLTMKQRAGAAGGAFLYGGGLGGGVGSAVGGIAGGIAGGVPGAFAGAAIGQVVDNMGTAMAGVTTQAATIQQLQRGLAMASVDAKDFAEAQATVGEMSGRILMPMEQTLRMFTQLRVNTKEYNLSVAETARIMEGTALAIQSTGGSTQDLEGAMRAVVQIMSKGSVQAEELRGQLGERFPGAVVKFAQANNMSFEELQTGLQQGKIGIAEFIKFAEQNYEDYAQFSQQLATAPEFAGKRLEIAFEQMQIAVGSTMGDAGAIIQDAVVGWIKDITQFVKDNELTLRKMYADFAEIFALIIKVVQGAVWVIRELFKPLVEFIQGLVVNIQIAVGSAGAAEYAIKLKNIDNEIAKVEASQDARSRRRLARLKQQRAEVETAFKGKGGEAALRGPAMTFGGPGAGVPTSREGADNAEAERRAKAYLDAIERREEGMAKAREQLEESLADIRKNATEEVERIERQYADKRLSVEREIARVRRDIAFELQRQALEGGAALRIIGGESPDLIDLEKQILEAKRQFTEEEINRKEQAQDEEIRKARELEDFRTKIAKAINEANLRYAKQVGEVQRAYAQASAKIFADTVETSGKRMLIAGRIASLELRREALNAQRKALGYQAIPLPGDYRQGQPLYPSDQVFGPIPPAFQEIDALRKEYVDELGALGNATPSAGQVSLPAFDSKRFDAEIQDAQRGLAELQKSLSEALATKNLQNFAATFTRFANQQSDKLAGLTQTTREQNGELQAQLELRRGGLRKEEVDSLARYRAQLNFVDKNLQGLVKQLEGETSIADAAQRAQQIEAQRLKIKKAFTEETALLLAQNRLYSLQLQQINEAEERANEQRREAIQLVEQSVSGAMSSYKEFLGAIVKGEGMKDALSRMQQAFRDQAVTLFFDFAMKPMEKMLKEQLTVFFGLETEEALLKRLIAEAERQVTELRTLNQNLTGQGAAAPVPTPPPAGVSPQQPPSTPLPSPTPTGTAPGTDGTPRQVFPIPGPAELPTVPSASIRGIHHNGQGNTLCRSRREGVDKRPQCGL
jgi:tape measure domain-containing protein